MRHSHKKTAFQKQLRPRALRKSPQVALVSWLNQNSIKETIPHHQMKEESSDHPAPRNNFSCFSTCDQVSPQPSLKLQLTGRDKMMTICKKTPPDILNAFLHWESEIRSQRSSPRTVIAVLRERSCLIGLFFPDRFILRTDLCKKTGDCTLLPPISYIIHVYHLPRRSEFCPQERICTADSSGRVFRTLHKACLETETNGKFLKRSQVFFYPPSLPLPLCAKRLRLF